jgi:hypothetical protein
MIQKNQHEILENKKVMLLLARTWYNLKIDVNDVTSVLYLTEHCLLIHEVGRFVFHMLLMAVDRLPI